MPFLYTVGGLVAGASYNSHATPSTEDATLVLRQAVRGFDVTAAYCNGRATSQTTLTGLSYITRRWTTAGTGGTAVVPNPRRIGTTASTTAADKASAITVGTISGVIQFAMGCGKSTGSGWVARDADSAVHVEAGRDMTSVAPDIAVIGGGIAGATAAAMLGKAGHEVVFIDPHTEQRPEFRCEKLDESQLALLRQYSVGKPRQAQLGY